MEAIRLEEGNFRTAVEKAAEVLRSGGVVLYPTDTLYGLGADAFSDEAVAKVCALKGRDEQKPIHCIVADMEMAEQYVEMNLFARKLADEFLPGALTLILKKKDGLESGIAKKISTIGIRIPANDFCIALAREYGKPFTTTSANRAGEEPERGIEDILHQLGHTPDVGLIIDAGTLPERAPSTVVDLSGETPIVLREGAIPLADIWDILGTQY